MATRAQAELAAEPFASRDDARAPSGKTARTVAEVNAYFARAKAQRAIADAVRTQLARPSARTLAAQREAERRAAAAKEGARGQAEVRG